ncbi:biogenesis of lysosome-related organelles complex 1 subunit 6 isoform X2 [Arvicanthis niloticus]|uniref:biogenesis of lysosome-related organelles complex 1 subunit 6 isoform X2 n=1 Tax=Arvicanthis niloticus TaxID=61156 RepID=UPI00402B39D4
MSVPEPPPPDGLLTGLSDRLEAGEPTPGLSDTSPDEGLIEDFAVEDRAVEHLVGGLLSHYLPDLQRSKRALQELTQNQVVLLDTLEQEISKFKECHSMLDINALFTEAKHYHAKLVSIRREMLTLHERTSKLKLDMTSCRAVVAHVFNPSTWEAEAGRFLSSRPAWSTK